MSLSCFFTSKCMKIMTVPNSKGCCGIKWVNIYKLFSTVRNHYWWRSAASDTELNLSDAGNSLADILLTAGQRSWNKSFFPGPEICWSKLFAPRPQHSFCPDSNMLENLNPFAFSPPCMCLGHMCILVILPNTELCSELRPWSSHNSCQNSLLGAGVLPGTRPSE